MVDGYRIGNQNPKKRGLDRNIRNSKKKKGCPLTILVFLAGCVATVASGWALTQQLFG